MAAADFNAIRKVIEDKLSLELARGTLVPVVFGNISYSPTVDLPWVQCLIDFGSSEYLSQGGTTNSCNRINGVTVINIYTKKGAGAAAGFALGKRIRDLYNRLIVSGIFFDAPIGPEVIANASPPAFFQTQVRVTFEVIEEL